MQYHSIAISYTLQQCQDLWGLETSLSKFENSTQYTLKVSLTVGTILIPSQVIDFFLFQAHLRMFIKTTEAAFFDLCTAQTFFTFVDIFSSFH